MTINDEIKTPNNQPVQLKFSIGGLKFSTASRQPVGELWTVGTEWVGACGSMVYHNGNTNRIPNNELQGYCQQLVDIVLVTSAIPRGLCAVLYKTEFRLNTFFFLLWIT